VNDVIMAALVTPEYVFDPSHVTLVEVPSVARIATSPITARTATAGWANGSCLLAAADLTLANGVLIYKDTGNAAQSALIAYYDIGFGLPATEAGSYNFIHTGLGYFRL